MNIENDYINKINVLSLIFISIYCIVGVGYDIQASNKLTYILIRFITNLGFPLLLMTFGALVLNNNHEGIGFVKKFYKCFIPPFLIWNIILGILIIYYNGFNSFVTTITHINWFVWIVMSNVLVIPILSEFLNFEKESGVKYLLALFFIAGILWSLSVQFKFSLYYIDLVFFAQPLCFMVLGYYLANKQFKSNSYKILITCLIILIITLFIRFLLIIKGIAAWNLYFIQIFGTTLQIGVDPFTLIEVSSIFLIVKSFNGVLKDNSVINLYSKKTFSLIMILGIFSFILSKLSIKLNWFKLAIFSTILFFIITGIFFALINKSIFLKKIF